MNIISPPGIKSRQIVTFDPITIPATGVTVTDAQAITPVDLTRAVIKVLSTHGGFYSSSTARWYGWIGLEFQDASNALATWKTTDRAGTLGSIIFVGEIIEYYEKPKSIQLVSADGDTSQSINTVDPNRCELVRAYEYLGYAQEKFTPTLNANTVTWDSAPNTAARLFVVEW